MSAGPGTEWSGPWANDAQRLFRMLQQAAEGEAPGGGHSPQSHSSAAECRYCPFCQALSMIRRSGPEVLDRVAEFAAGLAATLRAAGPEGADQDQDPDRAAAGAEGDPARAPAPADEPLVPPMVRIDITD